MLFGMCCSSWFLRVVWRRGGRSRPSYDGGSSSRQGAESGDLPVTWEWDGGYELLCLATRNRIPYPERKVRPGSWQHQRELWPSSVREGRRKGRERERRKEKRDRERGCVCVLSTHNGLVLIKQYAAVRMSLRETGSHYCQKQVKAQHQSHTFTSLLSHLEFPAPSRAHMTLC